MIGISTNQEHFGLKARKKILSNGRQEGERIYPLQILINLKMIGQRILRGNF
jgi:hypothetical protein